MYQNDIVSLAHELERLKDTSVDIVASTKDIRAEASKPTVDKPELNLNIRNYKPYPLTHHAGLQLADNCGIPREYYKAMLVEGMIDLTAQNVNTWLTNQANRKLVRVTDGRVRALLSDRYRVLDNYDLAIATLERAREHEAQIQECNLTDTRMYIKLVVPKYRELLAAPSPAGAQTRACLDDIPLEGDPIVPGLVVSNSEVGDGAFRVEPFLFRLVCKNGLIGQTSLYKVHLGQKLELGELIFKDDTRKKMDEALWAQVRDVIDSTFNPEVLKTFVAKLRDAQKMPIDNPTETVENVAQDLALSKENKISLLRYFAKEGDTVFGLVNGITRLAQNFELYEDRVRLERHAGELLLAEVTSK